MLANVTHDLRTPLNGIITLANVMENKRNRKMDEILKTFTSIKKIANLLKLLVNDIIDQIQIKNKKLNLIVE